MRAINKSEKRRSPATGSIVPPVVGIGVSGEGLAALKSLLGRMDTHSGASFVVATPYSSDNGSDLIESIQTACAMVVRPVSDPVDLKPDHVYVVSRRSSLEADGTLLRLAGPDRGSAPMDRFFGTLAESHRDRSAGILLTGNGSDGTRGLRRIKEMGGLTVVQDPGEAEPDGTPRSATASDFDDMVLPLARIPDEILRFARAGNQHSPSSRPSETDRSQTQVSGEKAAGSIEQPRATLEAFEAANEKLQARNEELTARCRENRVRVEELERLARDLQNHFDATGIVTLFLDRSLRLVRFTPRTAELFDLSEADLGRPLADLTHRLDYEDLEADARLVLAESIVVEREIQGGRDDWYLARTLPCRSTDDSAEGVVITFVGIDSSKRVEEALRRSRVQLARELAKMTRLPELLARLLASPDLFAGLGEVLAASIDLSDAAMGSIQRFDPERQVLEIVAHRGFRQEFLDDFRAFGLGTGAACETVLANEGRAMIEDIEADPAYRPYRKIAASAGYRAVQSVPLKARDGAVLGILSLHFREPRPSSDRNSQFLDLHARLAAEIMERIRRQRDLAREKETLARRIDEQERERRIILENVPAYLAYLDSELRFRFLNRVCLENFDIDQDDFLGERIGNLATPDSWRVLEPPLSAALAGEEGTFELALDLPGGGRRILQTHCVPRRPGAGETQGVEGVFLLATDITAERFLQLEVLEAAQREKENFSRDLHDNICQELGGVAMFGKVLADKLERCGASETSEARDLMRKINEINAKARRMARGLSPVVLENRGFPEAFADMAGLTGELFEGLDCRFIDRFDGGDLDKSIAMHLFFIAKEAVYNATRHAKPTQIIIVLESSDGGLTLSVTDNGGTRASGIVEGIGIRSMRYRARILGGELVVRDNEDGNGLEICCSLTLRS